MYSASDFHQRYLICKPTVYLWLLNNSMYSVFKMSIFNVTKLIHIIVKNEIFIYKKNFSEEDSNSLIAVPK